MCFSSNKILVRLEAENIFLRLKEGFIKLSGKYQHIVNYISISFHRSKVHGRVMQYVWKPVDVAIPRHDNPDRTARSADTQRVDTDFEISLAEHPARQLRNFTFPKI